jgi:hypothetical protein
MIGGWSTTRPIGAVARAIPFVTDTAAQIGMAATPSTASTSLDVLGAGSSISQSSCFADDLAFTSLGAAYYLTLGASVPEPTAPKSVALPVKDQQDNPDRQDG